MADVVHVQRDQFAAADAAGVKCFQHRPVAQANWCADVGDVQQRFDLVGAEHRGRQAVFAFQVVRSLWLDRCR